MYACKIKETTNGCRRGARGEARKALEVIVERSIAQDGKLNESKRVAEASEDETEKITEEKAPLGSVTLIALPPSPVSKVPSLPCLFL